MPGKLSLNGGPGKTHPAALTIGLMDRPYRGGVQDV